MLFKVVYKTLRDSALAAACAIQITRRRGLAETGPDELLLGCLQALARFGIVRLGTWTIDLERFGIDWLEAPAMGAGREGAKVSYSEAAVAIFDRAARIAKADDSAGIRVEHFLVAFTDEDAGVMGDLKRTFAIDSASWRAAAASLADSDAGGGVTGENKMVDASARTSVLTAIRQYLTPEEAADTLGIHVQTLRAYIRTGKLPALRLAGERSLRIRRCDLDKVLEPLVPEKQ